MYVLQNAGVGNGAQLVDSLLSMHEAVVQSPAPHEPVMAAQLVQVPSFRRWRQEEQVIKGILELHGMYEASLSYIRPFSKETNKSPEFSLEIYT